ncbi:hypothetical protein BD311DRAFT_703315 [Dichomitus squalens]|uniref:DUF6533 domain-containing protein n=1 Tax=Dichomitus squalens TaxID=114155 RepID=A0A4Q9MBE0_9APHY|nr:hypothetical protein BD311DRAFT_703315 [Dichomitus squalens]
MSSDLENVLENGFVEQICLSAGIALLLYDTFLTLDREISFMWARGRVRMIMLLFVIRHVQLASYLFNILWTSYNSVSSQVCTWLTPLSSIASIIPYIGWAAFLGWRAYALSTSNLFVGILVFCCSASFAIPALFTTVAQSSIYVAAIPGCNSGWRIPVQEGTKVLARLLDVSRPLAVLADLIVLTLTWLKTQETWLSLRNSKHSRSLPVVLLENGFVCFFVSTSLHIASWAILLRAEVLVGQYLSTIRDAVISVLLSRFILDLSSLGDPSGEPSQEPQNILTTEWIHSDSDVSSLYTIDEEYNGRGFDKDIEDV